MAWLQGVLTAVFSGPADPRTDAPLPSRELARRLARLLDDLRAGRRFLKVYRQFKTYNDPRLDPALAPRRS